MEVDFTRKVKKHRDRLFQRQVARLMQDGTKGLKPLPKYMRDKDQKVVVSLDDVGALFITLMKDMGFVNAEEYLEYLGIFLDIFRQGFETCSFTQLSLIPEEEILAATNKIKIDILTKNLIVAHFKSFVTETDLVNDFILRDGLKLLINIAGFDRNLEVLVKNTIAGLMVTLQEKKPWRACIDEIHDASLVCGLLGVKLSMMDKGVLDPILKELRKELADHNEFLTKIIIATDKLHAHAMELEKYMEWVSKLDVATKSLMEKIDSCLFHLLHLMDAINASSALLLGRLDSPLKENLVRMFFDYTPAGSPGSDILDFSKMRYKLNILLNYKSITRFCRELQNSPRYQDSFLNLFRLCFRSLAKEIKALSRPLSVDTIRVKTGLHELKKVQESLALDPDALPNEKDGILELYLAVIEKCHPHLIESLMDLSTDLVGVTRDQSRDAGDRLGMVLLRGCFRALSSFEIEASIEEKPIEPEILKLFYLYAVHYRPQRYFFKNFFNTFIGHGEGTPSKYLAEFINANPRVAMALLAMFSNKKYVEGLLSEAEMKISETFLAFPPRRRR